MRGYPGFSAYSATKFAVRSINQSVSQEMAKYKITCNVYCPSPVDTDMWTNIDKDLTDLSGAPVGTHTQQVRCDTTGTDAVAPDAEPSRPPRTGRRCCQPRLVPCRSGLELHDGRESSPHGGYDVNRRLTTQGGDLMQ